MSDPHPAPELVLEFPPKPEYVRAARHTVAALASMAGFPDELVDDVRLAVSEACTNAVVSNAEAGAGSPAPVEVRAGTNEDGIELEVLDRGSQQRPEVSGSPLELGTEDLPFDRALSLPLIRGLVDEVDVAHREGGGTVVRMRLQARESPGGE